MGRGVGSIFGWVGGSAAIIGLGFVVAMVFADGVGRLALLPPAVSLLIVGFVFWRTGRRIGRFVWGGSKTLATGRPGRGTVTRMWETGVTLNEQPVFGFELDLEVEGVPSGTVEVQQVVPRMLAGAVLPGTTVAVKVDPQDPQQVVIDWRELPQPAEARAAAAPSASPLEQAVGTKSMDELLRRGRRGTARLRSVTDAGELGDLGMDRGDPELADDRLYVIEMDVKLPGRQPYPVRVGHRVPDRLVGRVAPGLEVQVAVDRDDEQRAVAIDWDASLP